MAVPWMLGLAAATAMMLTMMPRAIANYLGRLPYAPECPCCRTVTSQTAPHSAIDQICAMLAATPVRTCARCGWHGRMRWRPAYERARRT